MLKSLGKYRDYAPLFVRLMLGTTLVLSHGLPKLMSPDRWEREGALMAMFGITFAPVFWGAQATASARPESLVLFSVTVDDESYLCDGATIAALADRELSQDMFAAQCGV